MEEVATRTGERKNRKLNSRTVRKPRLSGQARLVLERRYLMRDSSGRVTETPADMLSRVARVAAEADGRYGSAATISRTAAGFYELMASLDFLPNSPTLINAGRELGQLSACFVLPVEDSIESIFNAVRDTALIHKSGGGTGFSFSSIRPANDLVKTTKGVSSGPVSFMNVFDVATETIKQGGVRRGANMGLLSVHHPDVMEFIQAKVENNNRFVNFNLSVSVTDAFMKAAREDSQYDLVNPHTGRIQKRLPAREVMEAIIDAAWRIGDPGLVFIDRINESNTLPHLGPIEATNPCGEQPLLPYESCTLGSINLARFVKQGRIDYPRLKKTVRQAVHFLDNIIDVNRLPLPEIERITRQNRKIGLGVMGLADMLMRLGLPYDDESVLPICRELMGFIQEEAHQASADLARIRGNFPSFEGSVFHQQGRRYMRNATVTTIAPTGSLSIIANCSSGIEPLFALAFRRRVLGGQELVEIHPWFKRLALIRGFWSEDLAGHLARHGTIRGYAGAPEELQRLFTTAHDLDPLWHLEVQAAFQDHTDNAVSKTVNLPREADVETVGRVYWRAWELGLKGVTVYRDGSRSRQVLSYGEETKEPEAERSRRSGFCPECRGRLTMDQGCWLCPECGYSHCE